MFKTETFLDQQITLVLLPPNGCLHIVNLIVSHWFLFLLQSPLSTHRWAHNYHQGLHIRKMTDEKKSLFYSKILLPKHTGFKNTEIAVTIRL